MCCCAQINGTAGPSLEMKGHCLCVGVGVGVVVGVDALPGLWLDKHGWHVCAHALIRNTKCW